MDSLKVLKLRLRYLVFVFVLTLISIFVSLWLKPTPKYHHMLAGVLWTSLLMTGVVPPPEWMKSRYLYIVASIKHRLYGPVTSTSGLLLLPPEIRLRIWEELTPRARCARGDTLVDVAVWDNDGDIEDLVPYVLRFKRRKQTRMRPTTPVAFLRTCRQNYEEGCHFYYSTSTFCFNDPLALCEFVNARPLSQQGIIRHLKFNADSFWYINPGCRRGSCAGCDWRRGVNLLASQVPSITEKLQDLRTLDIVIRDAVQEKDAGYYAHSIYQLLRHVKASEAVTVELDLRDLNRRSHLYPTMQWEWSSHCQKQFAVAAWRLIRHHRDPNSRIESAAQAEQVVQTKYVLVAEIPV